MAWFQRRAECGPEEPRPLKPATSHGDRIWATNYSHMTRRINVKPDLRDIVLRTLHEIAPGMTIEELRLRRGGRVVVEVRRTAIARSVLAGHRGVDVAAFLNVSPTTVSRVSVIAWANRSG
jgi:hypothetical protein